MRLPRLEVATPSLDARKLEKICFIHINFAESNFGKNSTSRRDRDRRLSGFF